MIKEVVKTKMVEAMKNKDKQRKEILSLVVSEITRAEQSKKEKLVTEARKAEAKRLNIEPAKVELSTEQINEINTKAVITEEEELAAIEKMAKSVKETINALTDTETGKCKIGKEENMEKAQLELSVYNEFLPKQLTEDEIKTVIEGVLDKLNLRNTATKSNMGTIRKELNPLVNGKADGKLVNNILMTYLK